MKTLYVAHLLIFLNIFLPNLMLTSRPFIISCRRLLILHKMGMMNFIGTAERRRAKQIRKFLKSEHQLDQKWMCNSLTIFMLIHLIRSALKKYTPNNEFHFFFSWMHTNFTVILQNERQRAQRTFTTMTKCREAMAEEEEGKKSGSDRFGIAINNSPRIKWEYLWSMIQMNNNSHETTFTWCDPWILFVQLNSFLSDKLST